MSVVFSSGALLRVASFWVEWFVALLSSLLSVTAQKLLLFFLDSKVRERMCRLVVVLLSGLCKLLKGTKQVQMY